MLNAMKKCVDPPMLPLSGLKTRKTFPQITQMVAHSDLRYLRHLRAIWGGLGIPQNSKLGLCWGSYRD